MGAWSIDFTAHRIFSILPNIYCLIIGIQYLLLYLKWAHWLLFPSWTYWSLIDCIGCCLHLYALIVVGNYKPMPCVPAPPGGLKQQRLAREVPPCPKWAYITWVCRRLVYSVCARPVKTRGQQRVTVLLLTFILSLQGSLYETSNLDRGGSNRKKKIEEFSRSSREKLVQSKNKMFSKFTSILQHAVEAVSLLPRAYIYPLACLLCRML